MASTGRFFKVTGFDGIPTKPDFARFIIFDPFCAYLECKNVWRTESPAWKNHFQGNFEVVPITRSEYNSGVLSINNDHESVGACTAYMTKNEVAKIRLYEAKNERAKMLLDLMHGLADAPDPNAYQLECILEDPTRLDKWAMIKTGAALIAASREQETHAEWVAAQVLRYWQAQLLEYMTRTADDDRAILWVYDAKGKTGKTWMAKYVYKANPNQTAWLHNGSTKDLMKILAPQALTLKTVLVDLSRTNLEKINWDVIERVKNGMIMSTKYDVERRLIDPPTVVCFANYEPNYERLSEDRWHLLKINEGKLHLSKVRLNEYGSYETYQIGPLPTPDATSVKYSPAKPPRNPFALTDKTDLSKTPQDSKFGGRIGVLKRCVSCYQKYKTGQPYPLWGNCPDCMSLE